MSIQFGVSWICLTVFKYSIFEKYLNSIYLLYGQRYKKIKRILKKNIFLRIPFVPKRKSQMFKLGERGGMYNFSIVFAPSSTQRSPHSPCHLLNFLQARKIPPLHISCTVQFPRDSLFSCANFEILLF